MNLIPLLQVSRSLVAGGSATGRYRFLPAAPVPAFGAAARRPRSGAIRTAGDPVPAQQSAAPARRAVVVPSPSRQVESAKRSGVLTAGAVDSGMPRLGGARRATGTRWRQWLRPAVWVNWMRRANPFEAGNLASGPVPRQGSLPLEGLQVARNDLVDADIEIVPPAASGGGWGFRSARGKVAGLGLAVAEGGRAVSEEAFSSARSFHDRS